MPVPRNSHCGTLVLAACLAAALPAAAQRPAPVRLSTVITAFLADSGVPTRGLPWTTGSQLPIKWATPGPVANTDPSQRSQGITLMRRGTFRGTAGDSVTLDMEIVLTGAATGLSGMSVFIESMEVTKRDGSGFFTTREMIERTLLNEGLSLQPLKCDRKVEGASYGNLVDAVKAPGKTSSGLWWSWQSAQQKLSVTIGLLYRRSEMAKVECYSG